MPAMCRVMCRVFTHRREVATRLSRPLRRRGQTGPLAPILLGLIIMRNLLFCCFLSAGACSSTATPANDASTAVDLSSGIDAATDAASAPPDTSVACPPLLVGGTDVAAQGWSIAMIAPATVSYGADYVRLQTSTPTGGRSGGMLLLTYSDAVAFNKPFKLRVELLVESVNPHNQLDSGAAILGSYTPASRFGSNQDRSQMIYLDSGKIGWGDDSQLFTTSVQDNTYHTYELAVDASQVAQVSVDGKPALTRSGFVFNGAIAIGDESNDVNVDGTIRIRSVTKVCP